MHSHTKIILGSFFVIATIVLLFVGLNQNPSAIRSPVMHQNMPHFEGLQVGDQSPFTDKDLVGKPYFLNIWATWCSSCVIEHPVWVKFAKVHPVNIVGVLYNDNLDSAQSWLKQNGNPYTHLVNDPNGKLIVNLGAYGTPETLFVDADGIIQKRFIGPVTNSWVNNICEEYAI